MQQNNDFLTLIDIKGKGGGCMSHYESSSELQLIRKAKRGDVKAFSELYARIYQELYKFALYTMKHGQDAEDVVSETVIIAYENMKKLKKEESFRSWIFTILMNQCRKHFKQHERTEELKEEMEAEQVTSEDNQDLYQAFQMLEDEERIILSCSVLEGYSSEEIGNILDMNPATVRSRKARALEKLRKILKREESEL